MSCHLQPNVAKAIGNEEKGLKKLIFTFEAGDSTGVKTPVAEAYIEITEKQFDNFFDLKNIVEKQNLTAVEMYMHGVKWVGKPPSIETSDFIIHRSLGVALKGYFHSKPGHPIQSKWFDWATMDLLYVMGDALVPMFGDQNTTDVVSTKTSKELSDVI
jgi:hypothetical protein